MNLRKKPRVPKHHQWIYDAALDLALRSPFTTEEIFETIRGDLMTVLAIAETASHLATASGLSFDGAYRTQREALKELLCIPGALDTTKRARRAARRRG